MKPNRLKADRVGALFIILLLVGLGGIILARMLLQPPAPPLAAAAAASSDLPQQGGFREKDAPDISFIDSPDATCYLPRPGTGACYIQWRYLNVSADPASYIISMTVSIDDQLRAYHAGFFQTSMTIPAAMTGPGYKVFCGPPRAAGHEVWGNDYRYTIKARETSGLSSANYGTVTCPADLPLVYIPFAASN